MDEMPKRWPLVASVGNRYTSPKQDSKLVNCYAEKQPEFDEYDVIRRPAYQDGPVFPDASGVAWGIYNWKPTPAFDLVMQVRQGLTETKLFQNNLPIGDVLPGDYYDAWEPLQSSTPALFFKAKGKGYTTDGAVVTAIADSNWSSFAAAGILPGAANLNGRLYILVAPNKVYGATNLNDGQNWSALNLILANDNPDWGTCITRYLQYVLVMKLYSTEVFQDEGNPTGSPLGKVQGISIPYGCTNTRCVVRINDDLFWPATSRNTAQEFSTLQVVRMTGLTPQVISTPKIDRLLTAWRPLTAYPLLVAGHKFYCIDLLVDGKYMTLAYDLTEGLWVEWHFPVHILGAAASPYGMLFQSSFGDVARSVASAHYDKVGDANIPLQMEIVTPNMDFSIPYKKQLNMLFFTGDQTVGTSLQIRRSDDDYKTWSNWRTVELDKAMPRIQGEGSFYRRAYHIMFNQAGPIRLRALGMALGLGST